MEHHNKQAGRFPVYLRQRMQELGLSIRDLAVKSDTSYEHIRRIVNGDYFCSKFVLKELCRVLQFNFVEAEKIVNADRLMAKYGATGVAAVLGRNPELAPIESAWGSLSEEQKRELIEKAKQLAESNARTETASSSAGRQADTNAV